MRKFIVLLLLSAGLFSLTAQTADSLLQTALQGPPDRKVKALTALGNRYFYSRPDSALMFIQRGLKIAVENNMTKERLALMNLLGIYYNENGKYRKAKEILEQTAGLARQAGDTTALISALGNLGNNRFYVGKFDEAIGYFTRITEMYESRGNIKGMANVYGALGNMYRQMENNPKALEYYKRSQEKFIQIHDTVSTALTMLNSAYILIEMNRLEKARDLLKKSYEIFNRKNIHLNAAKCLQGLSKISIQNKQYDQALNYSLRALKIFKKVDAKNDISLNYSYLANIYMAKKQYKMAEKYLLMAYRIDSAQQIYNRLENISANLKKVYDSLGDIQNAYRYANKYVIYHDSVFNIEANKKFSELEAKYETAQKQRKIEQLESKRKLDKAYFRILLISGISLILLLLVGAYMIVQKRKKQKEIAELELEKSRIQRQALSRQIELKNKQLAGHALNMMQKNQLLSALLHRLEEMIGELGSEARRPLKKLQRDIKYMLHSDKDWDTFKVYFEQINSDFLHRLKDRFPHLTTNDIRLAALLRLNMTNKEIASILNITHQSVKNALYRLKTKMNLQATDDLRDFVGGL